MPLKIVASGRTLTLTGDLDRDVYEQLQSSLIALADGHVVVDMANVGNVDEAGLRVSCWRPAGDQQLAER